MEFFTEEGHEELAILILGRMTTEFKKQKTDENKDEAEDKEASSAFGLSLLKSWLKSNLDCHYPSQKQINEFVKNFNLTETQVRNFFANARRRWPQLKNAWSKKKRSCNKRRHMVIA